MFNLYRKFALPYCCILFWLLAPISEQAVADELDVNQLQARIYSAVQKASPAVVAINDRGSIFSGVIISKEGYVFSAGHAVKPDRSYSVYLADGRRLRAKGLGFNDRIDMAMLKISDAAALPTVELGHSSALVQNQPCIGISHPGTFQSNRGAVVRFGYITKPITNNEGMICSTAMMEPGDSGGPLIDLDGKLIGIHSNIRRSENKNYDVPIDSFKQYMDKLKQPAKFKVDGWPSLPKLGFKGERAEDGSGVEVLKVYEGGLAEKSGLQPKDVVTDVAGQAVNSTKRVYDRLIELRGAGVNQIYLSIIRSGLPSIVKLEIPSEHPTPTAYPGIGNLVEKFQSLESRLDDVEFIAHSTINGKSKSIRATQIYRTGQGYLVSKSSMIGERPEIELADGSRISAEVVARDPRNDLVLLNAKMPGNGGIDMRNVRGDLQEQQGKLLLTPDCRGDGIVSIWGSKYFNIPRTRSSGGYLGVQLGVESGKVIFDQVLKRGAAQNAGLKSGDILIRLNDIAVKRERDVRSFLQSQDPNSKITAVILRNEQELSKEIVLGNWPDQSRHVANQMVGGKSTRRDGFTLAISHDAVLRPEKCGGPVFDIQGRFLGLNIARNSRSRCYIIPRTIVKQFVDQYGR